MGVKGQFGWGIAVGSVFAFGLATSALATTIDEDPLQAVCNQASDCSTFHGSGGDVILDSASDPAFYFRKNPPSPNPKGNFYLDVLVPDSAGNDGLHFSIDCNSGCGHSNPQSSLFSQTAWTSGDLRDYLQLGCGPNTCQPANPLSAWLGATNALLAPDVNGYFVYSLDFGSVDFTNCGPTNLSACPSFKLTFDLPVGTIIAGFMSYDCGTARHPKTCWVGTAPSEALLLDGPPSRVPEPVTLSLFGVGLVAMGLARSRRRKIAAAA